MQNAHAVLCSGTVHLGRVLKCNGFLGMCTVLDYIVTLEVYSILAPELSSGYLQ